MTGCKRDSWRLQKAVGRFLPWMMLVFAIDAVPAPNLDDLQRQLDDAKRNKTKPSRERPAVSTKEAAQEVPTGPRATLVVESDAPCELRVDGQRKAILKASEPVTIVVESGKQLLDCVSTESPSVKVREMVQAQAGTKDVKTLQLARLLVESRQLAACDGGPPRSQVMAAADGQLRQCGTRLVWAAADNGRDVDWNGARSYCASKGVGWDLPTVDEIVPLFDRSLPQIQCGQDTCRVPGQFRLSSYWFWGNELDGPSRARIVHLGVGVSYVYGLGSSERSRALCVRRL